MIQQLPESSGNVLGFQLSGKLHDADYQHFVPLVEQAIQQHGKIRLLAQFTDFHGWDLHAVWDDTKFSTKHCFQIEKVAIVGDQEWEKWMALVCKPFTMAKVKYFTVAESAGAWQWLQE